MRRAALVKMNPNQRVVLSALLLVLCTGPVLAQVPGKRVALVIGNAAYRVNPLTNPRNDAQDVAVALRKAGFSPVIEKNDLDFAHMSQAADDFFALAAGAEAALFYYSGHAAQANDENYLIPVDMDARSSLGVVDEKALKYWAFPIGYLADGLESVKARASVIVLDACRSYPVVRKDKSGVQGLLPYQAPEGIAILYATRAGETASDGGAGSRNSVYTAALLQRMLSPGLELSQLAALVGQDVRTATGGKQKPSFTSEIVGLFQLVPTGGLPPAVPAGMVFVPGGTFMMGSPASEARLSDDEGPQHQVTLSPFAIGAKDVTVGEFRAFVNATSYKTSAELGGGSWFILKNIWSPKVDHLWTKPGFLQSDSHPVVCVSWYDASAYCNWRSQVEGKSLAYRYKGEADFKKWPSDWNTKTYTNIACDFMATGYRLPTEAEWEYAAKCGPDATNLAVNAIYAGSSSIEDVAWFWDNSGGIAHPVAQKKVNALGLYDMAGNVLQWCQDWYGSDYYEKSSAKDPKGPDSGDNRVLRGGSWRDDASDLRLARRGNRGPWYRDQLIGFRLLCPQIGQGGASR